MSGEVPSLFDQVRDRAAEARSRLRDLSVSDEVREAVLRRIDRLERSADHDLTLVSRELSNVLVDLETGIVPIHE